MVCPFTAQTTDNSGIFCPVGHYCPSPTSAPYANPCPAGFYSDDYTITADTDCLSCPAGFACSAGANNLTNVMVLCEPGYYCPAESTSTQ
jgi:hypothetical protein